ncbi:hypothetical protein B0H14DRAFT_3446511 [Mycena olivaceomarginata]|nr:hypothetical protein B0H14DRAFT_3446511 [Mycena olivaceomarginata]
MTSRSKQYRPPKPVVSVPRDEEDKVPLHMRPEMPSNSESPRSSNNSGRSTPPLSSGSSTLLLSSCSRTKHPESIHSRLPSNPNLDDDPLYRPPPTPLNLQPNTRLPSIACSQPLYTKKPSTPAFAPSLSQNQCFLHLSLHLHLPNRVSTTTASPSPFFIPHSLTATTSPTGTYTLTSVPAPFRRPRPVQRAGQTMASQLLAAVKAEAQSIATALPPLQEGLPKAMTGMGATATTGVSATAMTDMDMTARTMTPPQRRTTMAVLVPTITKRGISPSSTREAQTNSAATAILLPPFTAEFCLTSPGVARPAPSAVLGQGTSLRGLALQSLGPPMGKMVYALCYVPPLRRRLAPRRLRPLLPLLPDSQASAMGALYAAFSRPHTSPPPISSLPPLFEDDVPGLYALCEWAQKPVNAQLGILNLHVLLLWVFDCVGVNTILESCRPLVTELAARTAQYQPDTL